MYPDIKPVWFKSAEYSHQIDEYTEKVGKVDSNLFADICAERITASHDNAATSRWSYPYHTDAIIHRESISLSATIVALALFEQYQTALWKKGTTFELKSACRLFLSACMAALITKDMEPRAPSTMKITNEQYATLTEMERELYDMLQITIDRKIYVATNLGAMKAYHKIDGEHKPRTPLIMRMPKPLVRNSANTLEEHRRLDDERARPYKRRLVCLRFVG